MAKFGSYTMLKHAGIILLALGMFFTLDSCKDACRKQTCFNDAFCHDGECFCKKWYSGEHCELRFNRNYAGTYYGLYTYSTGMRSRNSDSLVVAADQVIPNRLIVSEGYYIDFESDSTLVIPLQHVKTESDTFSIQGEGKYDVNWISVTYTKSVESLDDGEVEVSFIGEKLVKAED